jgi:hypothetical protein
MSIDSAKTRLLSNPTAKAFTPNGGPCARYEESPNAHNLTFNRTFGSSVG